MEVSEASAVDSATRPRAERLTARAPTPLTKSRLSIRLLPTQPRGPVAWGMNERIDPASVRNKKNHRRGAAMVTASQRSRSSVVVKCAPQGPADLPLNLLRTSRLPWRATGLGTGHDIRSGARALDCRVRADDHPRPGAGGSR